MSIENATDRSGNNRFAYTRGHDLDVVQASTGDIGHDRLWFSRSGNDLVIR